MATIDIGSAAVDQADTWGSPYTIIDLNNPANDTGWITLFELWFNTDATGVKVGTFSGSGTDYTSRDVETIGNVAAGSKQTFSGLNCDVTTDDFAGIYFATGDIERATSGSGIKFKSSDQFGAGVQTYSAWANSAISCYGTGSTIAPPSVTTQATSAITGVTATGNGMITSIGGENPNKRGVCYSSINNPPTTSDSKVEESGSFGTGAFSENLTGLSPATTYYARAYAINSGDIAYGSVDTFVTHSLPTLTTQAVTAIDYATATGHGTITDTGGENATVRGVCWSTSANPTTADSHSTENGSFGTGAFTGAIISLTGNTLYHVRAYATNSAGTAYGNDVTFTTLMSAAQAAGRYYKCLISASGIAAATSTTNRGYRLTVPALTTEACSSIATTSATGNGTITAVNLSNCTRRGFCYLVGTSGTPTIADSVAYDDGNFTAAAYTKSITGLTGGTSYQVRAYATNVEGTGYGSTVTLLTTPSGPTNVAATKGTQVDKVTITWTQSASATNYEVFRDGVGLGPTGDVATYDDTGADAPTVTPGSAVATDGTTPDYVTISVSGESVNAGTTHTYKLKASNASGAGDFSGTDTGHRAIQAFIYQWQRSAGDSDASYSNLAGATSDPYNDTTAPASP